MKNQIVGQFRVYSFLQHPRLDNTAEEMTRTVAPGKSRALQHPFPPMTLLALAGDAQAGSATQVDSLGQSSVIPVKQGSVITREKMNLQKHSDHSLRS